MLIYDWPSEKDVEFFLLGYSVTLFVFCIVYCVVVFCYIETWAGVRKMTTVFPEVISETTFCDKFVFFDIKPPQSL